MDTGRPSRSPVTIEFHRGPHGAIGRPAEWLAASGRSGHRAGRTIGRTRWSFVPTRAALWLRTLVLSG
jgi:hypothetical protein